MDLIHVLLALSHFIVAGLACNMTSVQKCFVNISEGLGIESNKIQGSELIGIINPSTLHDDQVKRCSALKSYDFAPLRQCITSSHCSDQPLPKDQEAVLPKLTWMSIVDMMEGICKPGCENLQSKNAAAAQCEMKTGTCNDLEESFDCYRAIIGSCEVLVTFTKSVFQGLGVFDMVEKHCPAVKWNHLESSAVNANFAGLACNMTSVEKCFVNISEGLGIESNKIQGSELIGIINPSTLHDDQVKRCSALKSYDFAPLRQCITSSHCSDQPLPKDQEAVLPKLTWMSIVDMMEGICKPGCENLQSKNAAAAQCEMKTGTCNDLEESFDCYRAIIGSCEVLVTFTKSVFQGLGVFDMVEKHCPAVKWNHLESSAVNANFAGLACNTTSVEKCFVNISEGLGIESNKIQGSELIGIINPSTLHDDQVKRCSALKSYDFAPLRQCITSSHCSDQPLPKDQEAVLPKLTWMSIVDMMEGICKPGCENLQSKNAAAAQCEMKTGTCNDLEESFDCYRAIIGSCEVLVTFTKSVFQGLGVFDMVEKHCPAVKWNHLESSAVNANCCPSPTLVLYTLSLLITCLLHR